MHTITTPTRGSAPASHTRSIASRIASWTRSILLVGGLLAGASAGSGCVNAIDRITDCQDICARYSDCFDASYDVAACRSRCSDKASHSENFDQKVDECENCLDDRSCSSATFNCATQCTTIVP